MDRLTGLPPKPGHRVYYGWFIVGAAGLVIFCTGPGQSYVFSVFIDSIIEDTRLSRTGISILYTASTVVSAVLVTFVSRLADRYGPRIMLAAAGLGLGAVCFGMATATNILLFFIVFAGLRALGQGSLSINCILLVNQWFVSRRGRAIGLMTLGAVISTALLPPFVRILIDSIGWRGAYAVLGVAVIALIVPVVLLIVRNRPEDVGLFPDGLSHPPVSETRPGIARVRRDTSVYRSPSFWLLALSLSSPSLVTTALIFHQTSIFQENGLSATLAAGSLYDLLRRVRGQLAGDWVRSGSSRPQGPPCFLDGDPVGDPGTGCSIRLDVRGNGLCGDDGCFRRILHHSPWHYLGSLLRPYRIRPDPGAGDDHFRLRLGGWPPALSGVSQPDRDL